MVGCDPSDGVEDELESDSEKRAASSGRGETVEARAIAGGGVGGCTTNVAAFVAPVIEASVGSDVGCACELRDDEVLRGIDGRGHPAIFEFQG